MPTGASAAFASPVLATMSPPGWVSMCGNLAPLASMVVTLAPIPTINEMIRNRSTMNLPLLPYSSMLVNAFLWTSYGFLKNESKVWIPNVFTLFCAAYYIQRFLVLAPKGASNLPGTARNHFQVGGTVIASAVIPMMFLPLSKATEIIGMQGVLLCLVLFASPLSSLKQVIISRSASSIPLPFTLACCFNCFFWSVFGLLEISDVMIYLPNLLGLSFGRFQDRLIFVIFYTPNHTFIIAFFIALFQLFLIMLFRNNKNSAKALELPL